MTGYSILMTLRQHLLEQIARCADSIKEIDRKIAILQSQSLEEDLNQAAEANS